MRDDSKVLLSNQCVFPFPVVADPDHYIDVQTQMMRLPVGAERTGLPSAIVAILPSVRIDREVTVGVAMIVQMRRVTWRRRVACWLRTAAMRIEFPT